MFLTKSLNLIRNNIQTFFLKSLIYTSDMDKSFQVFNNIDKSRCFNEVTLFNILQFHSLLKSLLVTRLYE